MIKAIIFDADGMLVAGERFSSRFSRDFGVPMEKIRLFFDNEFKDCILGKKDLAEEIKKYFALWEYTGTVEDILNYWFARDRIIDKKVVQAVENFKKQGIVCILATNQEKHAVTFMRKEMSFEKIFDFVVASSDVGFKKPQAEFFEEIFKKLPGIKREEILFFDDREENVKAANALGINSRLYTNIKDLENLE